jgi:hypothetical protein
MLSGSTAGVGAVEAGLAGESQERSRGTRARTDRHMDACSRRQDGAQVKERRCLETVVYPVV